MPFRKKTEKKKNPFEANLPIDNPDVKVVTASYKGNPFFLGVGTSTQREVKGSGQAGLKEGVKGEYRSQKDLKWELFHNLGALPSGFVPAEKLKDFMASAVTFSSGSASVYNPQTKFEEIDSKDLKELERKTKIIKRQGKIGKSYLDLDSWFAKRKERRIKSL
jgi:hypothetical protein